MNTLATKRDEALRAALSDNELSLIAEALTRLLADKEEALCIADSGNFKFTEGDFGIPTIRALITRVSEVE